MKSARQTGRHVQRNKKPTRASLDHGSTDVEMATRVKDIREKIRVLRSKIAESRAKFSCGRELPGGSKGNKWSGSGLPGVGAGCSHGDYAPDEDMEHILAAIRKAELKEAMGRGEGSREDKFRDAMARANMSVVDVAGDGNCLFRAVSVSVYGDANHHKEVRRACVRHMTTHYRRFRLFLSMEERVGFLGRISRLGEWGGEHEIRALEELYDRPITIYSSESQDVLPRNTLALDVPEVEPILVSYHGENHYNAIRKGSTNYPLQKRRTQKILRLREAEHADAACNGATTSTAAAAASASGTRLSPPPKPPSSSGKKPPPASSASTASTTGVYRR